MPETARGDVEILVHVSARSHGNDDRKYRALAHAYLDFMPARRQKVNTERHESSSDVLDIEAGSQLQAELQQSTQESRESRASWQPDKEEDDASPHYYYGLASQTSPSQLMISPELSFTSVADNVASPAFQTVATCDRVILREPLSQSQEPDSADSWKLPSGSVADSQPELAQSAVVVSSPTRMFEQYLLNSPKIGIPSSGSYGERVNETLLDASSIERESHVATSPILDPFPTLRSLRLRSERLLRAQKHIFSSRESPTPERGALILEPLPADSRTVPSSSEQSRSESSPSPVKSLGRRFDRTSRSQHLASASIPDRVDTCTMKHSRPEDKNPLVIDLTSTTILLQETEASSKQNRTCYGQPSKPAISKLLHPSPSLSREISPSSSIRDFAPHSRKRLHVEFEKVRSSSDLQNQTDVLSSQDLPTRPCKRQDIVKMPMVQDTQTQSSSPTTVPTLGTTTMEAEFAWSEALEIHPAPPLTSTGDLEPEMLITESLAKLAQTVGIVHLPIELKREPRPMERGYWLVDCSRWGDDLRGKCWNMLGNYVGKGSAGWGVWCVRNEDHSSLRVYCWGIVIEHIYKLLYLSSGKKTTNNGLCWISGDGEAIIRMQSSA